MTYPLPPGSLGTYFRATWPGQGPRWLTVDGDGGPLVYSLATVLDGFTERLRLALLARFPQWTADGQVTAPDDALAAIGRDRRIVRGVDEGSVSYAARLVSAIDTWAHAGSAFGLLGQLSDYTGPGPAFRTVDVRGNWYSLDVDGTKTVDINLGNWDWDDDPDALSRWSRFWVIIYPNGLWTPTPTFGAGMLFGSYTGTIGSTATIDEVRSVRGIVGDWKPEGTVCSKIILAFDNASFNPTTPRDTPGMPDGTWGHWSKLLGYDQVPSRLATARYWDGV